jgi:hypothetical protein
MKTPSPDIDPFADAFVEALQSDLPTTEQEARVRARLLAAGILGAGAALTTSTSAAALGTSGVTSNAALGASAGAGAAGAGAAGAGAAGGLGAAPVVLVKAGLLSKVLMLPLAAKVGVAATLAVAVAATSAPLVLKHRATSTSAQTVAAAPGALPGNGPSPGKGPSVAPLPSVANAVAAPGSGAPLGADRGGRSIVAGTVTATAGVAQRKPARRDANASTPVTESAADSATPRRSASRARSATVTASESTLGEEARLMEQAMLALGEGDTDLARRALEEHARRFPAGLLQPERERALERLGSATHAADQAVPRTDQGAASAAEAPR